MTRGALRFTEEQFRAHREKSDRFKVAHTTSGGVDGHATIRTGGNTRLSAALSERLPPVPPAGVESGPLTPQRPPEDSSRPLLPARGAPIAAMPAGLGPGLPKEGTAGSAAYRDAIDDACLAHEINLPTTEFRFHGKRRWRFDFAWIDERIALEVEGGVWTQGRHTRGKGFLADMEKYNAAVLLGWRVLRTTPDKLADGVKSVRLLMLA